MKTKLLKYTDAFAKALRKGAHRREMTQHEFIMIATAKELRYVGDTDVDQLLDEHEANIAAAKEEGGSDD